MPEQTDQVDGFSDNTAEGNAADIKGVPGSPDPGHAHGAKEPLSAEEYAKLKKEAEENSDDKDKS